MEEIIILYSPAVSDFLNELADTLFEEEYFGFKESAKKFVDALTLALEEKIRIEKVRLTPRALLRYGEYYTFYKTAKRTAWYAFFSFENNRVLIKHITNNHVADAGFLEHL